VLNSTT